MGIRVHDTLTRAKREFTPATEGLVRIYVCGVTPYAETHIGHARPSVFWDVVRRYLEYSGYRVRLVQNFTDIDDKVIARAQAEGEDALSISRRYSEEYLHLMTLLGVRPADVHPKVSEHVDDILRMVKVLVDRGVAYERDGNVWFDVTRFPGYGKLSGRPLDELRAGARVEVDPEKRHPGDFALWKRAKPGEPSWPSPWGPGRPGWHIECSVMALKYLGADLDFHGGGTDLVFPHHENELAQSEAATGERFCRFWVHNEMLNLRGEKMSKSLGNVVTLKEALDRAPGGAVRLLLLGAHYRKALDFDFDLLEENRRAWRRLNDAVDRLRASAGREAGLPDEAASLVGAAIEARRRFEEAMDDDFNTPEALAALFDLTRQVNSALAGRVTRTSAGRAETDSAGGVAGALEAMEELGGGVLGVVEEADAARSSVADADDGRILELLIEVRKRLRDSRQFSLADYIRDSLAELGYELQDGPEGTTARKVR